MKKKTKDLLVKIVLTILFIISFSSVIVGYVFELAELTNIEPYKFWHSFLCVLFFVFDIAFIIIYHLFIGNRLPTTKFKRSHKYEFSYKNFEELYNDVSLKLKKDHFSEKVLKITDKDKMHIFTKFESEKSVVMWVLSDYTTYNKNKEKLIKKVLGEYLEELFVGIKRIKTKNFHLLCVKEYTEDFESQVKETYIDGERHLTVGLCWKDKLIYVASPKELVVTFTEHYDALNEEFFSVVDATLIKKEKRKK